ncbi:MAG: ABC transporter permease [Candidatus Hydrogenedens sp.]|nr:ABC transporter permease [Candidatus Hydrogenedens sp.]
MPTADIQYGQLLLGYGLLLFPLAVFLWYGIPLIGQTLISALRMTVQLLFIGFYLQVLFDLDNLWLNMTWLAVMIVVADASIIRGCGLNYRFFMMPLFFSLFLGTVIPLLIFLLVILYPTPSLEARFIIPISGMILGNCLRADIVGIQNFYHALRQREKEYFFFLSSGASLQEAIRPFLRNALQAALAPSLATMATMGLVSVPGMMTGIMMGGVNPAAAIKYQIAIMIAIFSGTAITVTLAIYFSRRRTISAWGVLNQAIFTDRQT